MIDIVLMTWTASLTRLWDSQGDCGLKESDANTLRKFKDDTSTTPGAEPHHEIFCSFFKVVFVKGTLPSRHHQNSFEGFAAFCQSTFC